jgi:hypothetical protein
MVVLPRAVGSEQWAVAEKTEEKSFDRIYRMNKKIDFDPV